MSLPLADDADVIVCGAGPAGVAAAITAARAGARVRLFEWRGCLGGVWTAGLLGYLLDFNKTGFARELALALAERGLRRGTSAKSISYEPEGMKHLLEEWCDAAGVRFQLHTRVAAAYREDRRLRTIVTESKSGRQAWRAPVFIDTTGDGDLGALAGCAFEIGQAADCPCQPMSLNALLVCRDAAALEGFLHGADPRHEDAAAKARLREEIKKTGWFPSYGNPTMWRVRDNLLLLMANHEYGVKPFDADQVTRATVRARAELQRIVTGLRGLGGPWEGLQIAATAEQIGVRDGRRLAGRYRVTKDDVVRGARFDDAVTRPTFPVDIHAATSEANRTAAYSDGGINVQPYDIPLRALVARDVDGLMMAGRCISGDFIAHASYRVTGNAVAMGEAAGAVAAVAARSHRLPHEVAWREAASLLQAALLSFAAWCGLAGAAELRFVGALGNSTDAAAACADPPAPGMGPVVDDAGTIWERAGGSRLNRWAADGRLLASVEIPASDRRDDQLTRVGGRLLLKIGRDLFSLPLDAAAGATVERLDVSADVLSSSAAGGRVALFDRATREVSWFDPATRARTRMLVVDEPVTTLHVAADGTVHGFGAGGVRAWRDGEPVAGFPRWFKGERPQQVGSHWYSHSWHGTIDRWNELFRPDPGVVLGGGSGSFIGYLPQSADLTMGRGLARLRDDVFAVTGLGGVVQLLAWDEAEQRFDVVRRIGALPRLAAVALDAAGTVWTPHGSWRWSAGPDTPLSLGDHAVDTLAQPIVLEGTTLCAVRKRPGRAGPRTELLRGRLLDDRGWSHLDFDTVDGFELPDSVTGATAVSDGKRRRLVFATREGRAFEMPIASSGRASGPPVPLPLPGLASCTSLAWFEGRLLAAGAGEAGTGEIVAFAPGADGAWTEAARLSDFGAGPLFIHSDGIRLAVSDEAAGCVLLRDSLTSTLARHDGLLSPGVVAVAGDRVVVHEAGRQRLVKLELGDPPPADPPLAAGSPPPPPAARLPFTDDDFQDIGRPGGIPCGLAVSTGPDGGAAVAIRTAPGAEIDVGVANADRFWILTAAEAVAGAGRFDFHLPAGDWSRARIAVAVRLPHEQERFGFRDGRAIHASFDPDPRTWAVFDTGAHRELLEGRHAEIRLSFEQPMPGKSTIVIEDAAGRRVRNLAAGRRFAAGRHTVVWDGLDEQGAIVKPGSYRYRGISHPGVEPVYRMNFANGDEPTTAAWGPNHSTLHRAAGNGRYVFCAAPVTEGGWALMALDAAGQFVRGYDHQHGFGIGTDAIAADDRHLYCAQDGFSWGGRKDVDLKKPDWRATWKLTVVRYDIESGKLVEFPGRRQALEVDTMEVGPGAGHPDLEDFNLGGIAVRAGRLYVGSRDEKAVLVFDAESGERVEAIPLAGVRHLAAGADAVFAATDAGVVRLGDPRVIVPAGGMSISGLAIGADGHFWVSDAATHQVRRFTAAGAAAGTIGQPGGPYRGAYVPERMVHPAGLAFGPDGKLWVTEKRWNPKRVLAWDLAAGRVAVEKFGMPRYGGDGGGFDPENPRRWIGLGCFWDVDLETGTARPTHVLSRADGHLGGYHPHGYQWFREAGRTFVSARGKIALVSEVLPDGTLHDLVATAGAHHFAYAFGWDPPPAYIDAFYARWPEKREEERSGRKGEGKPWAQKGAGVLWVDRNGDGEPQREEFDFLGGNVDYAGAAWGHLQHSLTLSIPLADKGVARVVSLPPRGFLATGVPDYPTLEEAVARHAVRVPLTTGYQRTGVSTVRDRFGRILFNSDPEMNAFTADGAPAWTYPNQWSNVHGSHRAPLPEAGVLQGAMAFLGRAEFDEAGDVVFLNGNHGRCYLLTTDGLYLDEAFVDVRVSYLKDEYRLGGEIFGGSFGRDGRSGRYFVQIGHGPYRIYELRGLGSGRRFSGTVDVTAAQLVAAERQSRRKTAAAHRPRTATIPGTIAWNKGGLFPVEVTLAGDAAGLRLRYRVADPSPWVNQGRDWTTLFASGDTVDFQFAADPAADPARRGPVPGDKRLVIAPFEGRPVAVLYEHRRPGGTHPVEFTSPWRGEKVDQVERLDDAAIDVRVTAGSYEVTAAIPWRSIGLEPEPGRRFRADFGVTYGDAEGTDTNLRSHWSNQDTGLVDDIPGEIMLVPALWGEVEFPAS